MDPQKSQFVSQGSVVVGCQERMMHLYIEPRDSYENICDYSSDDELSLKDLFQTVITEVSFKQNLFQLVYSNFSLIQSSIIQFYSLIRTDINAKWEQMSKFLFKLIQ